MKSSNPRIITVATEIATVQLTLTKNLRRVDVLEAELSKLKVQNEGLVAKQLGLAREMDKLSTGTEVQT